MTKLRQVSDVIGHMEGFYVSQEQAAAQNRRWPTIPQRLNNPGDLVFEHQKYATPHSIVGIDGKTRVYAKFDTIEHGWEACDLQLSLYAQRGLTVEQAIRKWAPADDGNNPGSYTASVCRMLGCGPGDLLSVVIAETAA
jgi:hypothetical protein